MHNKHKCVLAPKSKTDSKYFDNAANKLYQGRLCYFFCLLACYVVCFQSIYVCVTQLAHGIQHVLCVKGCL